MQYCTNNFALFFITNKPKTRHVITPRIFKNFLIPGFLPDRLVDKLIGKMLGLIKKTENKED